MPIDVIIREQHKFAIDHPISTISRPICATTAVVYYDDVEVTVCLACQAVECRVRVCSLSAGYDDRKRAALCSSAFWPYKPVVMTASV